MSHVLKTGFFDCVLQLGRGGGIFVLHRLQGFVELQTLMQIIIRILIHLC